MGGSGKTPFTLYVARGLRARGVPVVLGLSGYGSPASESAHVAPEGDLDPARWGDEPALVRWRLPDVPLMIGRDRVHAAQLAAERFTDHVLLMDDGFQHLRLAPHVNLLLDPAAPNMWCLPAGPYREPISGRRRAHLVLPSDEFGVVLEPTELTTPAQVPVDPHSLGGEVDALCALAQPFRFGLGLERLDLTVVEARWLPDHDPLTRPGLLDRLGETRPLVVSAKDWVKLRRRTDLGSRTFLIADYRLSVDPEPAFWGFLFQRLHDAFPDRGFLARVEVPSS